MKKVILLVVLVVAVWFGVNYLKTGQWSLTTQGLSQEERALRDLEKELADVNARIAQSGRAAGMTGMDTTADVAALVKKKADLERRIAEARKKPR